MKSQTSKRDKDESDRKNGKMKIFRNKLTVILKIEGHSLIKRSNDQISEQMEKWHANIYQYLILF